MGDATVTFTTVVEKVGLVDTWILYEVAPRTVVHVKVGFRVARVAPLAGKVKTGASYAMRKLNGADQPL